MKTFILLLLLVTISYFYGCENLKNGKREFGKTSVQVRRRILNVEDETKHLPSGSSTRETYHEPRNEKHTRFEVKHGKILVFDKDTGEKIFVRPGESDVAIPDPISEERISFRKKNDKQKDIDAETGEKVVGHDARTEEKLVGLDSGTGRTVSNSKDADDVGMMKGRKRLKYPIYPEKENRVEFMQRSTADDGDRDRNETGKGNRDVDVDDEDVYDDEDGDDDVELDEDGDDDVELDEDGDDDVELDEDGDEDVYDDEDDEDGDDDENGNVNEKVGGKMDEKINEKVDEKVVGSADDGDGKVDKNIVGERDKNIVGERDKNREVRGALKNTEIPIKNGIGNIFRYIIDKAGYGQAFVKLLNTKDHDGEEEEEQPEGRSYVSNSEKKIAESEAKEDLESNSENLVNKKELPKGNKRDEMIKEYVSILLNNGEKILKENVSHFLKRIFNLIVKEKLMTSMCHNGEETSTNVKLKEVKNFVGAGEKESNCDNVGCDKRNKENCRESEKSCPEDEKNHREREKNHQESEKSHQGSEKGHQGDKEYAPGEKRSTEKNASPKKCFLSKLKDAKFFNEDDLYKYYISLEDMLKDRKIQRKNDKVSKYLTFHPVENIREHFENIANNNIFIESLRIILFDSHKKHEQDVYSSFVVVIDTLFSLIKEQKGIKDMYTYVQLFFEDLNKLNMKVLDSLKVSSMNESKLFDIPDFTITNFEYILSKIYSRSVLANILSEKMDNLDINNLLQFLKNRVNNFNFSFIDNSVSVTTGPSAEILLSTASISTETVSADKIQMNNFLMESDNTLCKFIPIKKKLLYEKLNVTRKVAEEVILDYLFRLLLKKVHEYVLE
ncbi:hypothetical protein, conserved [Plasmodium gonderi]|uniref:Uncharacterized protein n=1 Tax=Plasmodium gonderi TaxID=77519 RepID=A0A1Y1JC29_PLAGO|nr:hypothetical protein, conserved [Plasmodium gonderi]GAW79228.1 hypothetical protein, conserved [Plasmodium gonderi]